MLNHSRPLGKRAVANCQVILIHSGELLTTTVGKVLLSHHVTDIFQILKKNNMIPELY